MNINQGQNPTMPGGTPTPASEPTTGDQGGAQMPNPTPVEPVTPEPTTPEAPAEGGETPAPMGEDNSGMGGTTPPAQPGM